MPMGIDGSFNLCDVRDLAHGTIMAADKGTADELGCAIAAAADEKNGYLAGVDILCDGGCTNGKKFR